VIDRFRTLNSSSRALSGSVGSGAPGASTVMAIACASNFFAQAREAREHAEVPDEVKARWRQGGRRMTK